MQGSPNYYFIRFKVAVSGVWFKGKETCNICDTFFRKIFLLLASKTPNRDDYQT